MNTCQTDDPGPQRKVALKNDRCRAARLLKRFDLYSLFRPYQFLILPHVAVQPIKKQRFITHHKRR